MVVIVFGLPGSGKSYLATRLASLLVADFLSSDQVRKQVLVNKTYSENERFSVYQEMLVRLKSLIKKNRNVVVDATFHKNLIRELFSSLLPKGQVPYFIEVRADESLVRERLKKPREDSDADYWVYEKIKQQWEPMTKTHLILWSTNNNIKALLNEAMNYLPVHHDAGTN